MRTRSFSRFKYAEEFCQDLTHARLSWQMTVKFDTEHEEDGETYIYDEFIVDWLTPQDTTKLITVEEEGDWYDQPLEQGTTEANSE